MEQRSLTLQAGATVPARWPSRLMLTMPGLTQASIDNGWVPTLTWQDETKATG